MKSTTYLTCPHCKAEDAREETEMAAMSRKLIECRDCHKYYLAEFLEDEDGFRCTKMKKCLGYGLLKGVCSKPAGTAWTPYWCTECDALRRATITKNLDDIAKQLSAIKEKN